MRIYGRVVGLLTFTGVVGLLLGVSGAAPEVIREAPCPLLTLAAPESVPTLPVPITWEEPTKEAKAVKAVKAVKATKSTKESRSAVRESLIAELKKTLEQTKSSAALMAGLEAMVALDAPAETVLPLCLRALERLDSFKPLPTEPDSTQAMLLEGIGECMRVCLEKGKLIKPPTTTPAGMWLPSPHYLDHPPQFFPAECPAPFGAQMPPGCIPAMMLPGRIPEPMPTSWRKPMMADPVPVQGPQTCPPTMVPTTSHRPPVAVSESGLIPVSTLPPVMPRSLEAVPANSFDPSRLVPVPTPDSR